jgi:peptidoglycan lytic transglycosylase
VDQRKVTLALASLFISGSAAFFSPAAFAEPAAVTGKVIQSGRASWYGPGFQGRRTASGETFDTNDMTAAHRTLPFGTKVRVVNKKTGRSVVVRINDRGPYAHGRVIDLSKASAQALGISGVGSVDVAQL